MKFEMNYDFIRCFSFKKTEFACTSNCGTPSNIDFLSIHPQMFLDYENDALNAVLTKPEQNLVVESKLLGVTINNVN